MTKKSVKAANVTVNIKAPKAAKSRTRTIIREKLVQKEDPVIKLLVENFAGFQRTFAHLSERFDSMTMQISDLLRLFELTARNIAEKPELGFEKEFTDKLNAILEQNKIIAKGVSLISQQTSMPPAPMQMPVQQPTFSMPQPKAPPMPVQQPIAEPSEEYGPSGYQASGERKPRPLPQL